MNDLKTNPRPLDQLTQFIHQQPISTSAQLVFKDEPSNATNQNKIWADEAVERSEHSFSQLLLLVYCTDEGWEQLYLIGETKDGWLLVENMIRDDTSAQ